MTRFWITLDQGVNFVEKAFHRMSGGEVFMPKMPSIKITDLAKAMNPNKKIKIVGIRPAEKIHESMSSKDESQQVIEFKDHYVIIPAFKNTNELKKEYLVNKISEKGNFVEKNFNYYSNNNSFLNVKDINKELKKIGLKY